jgi:hypothetical protein
MNHTLADMATSDDGSVYGGHLQTEEFIQCCKDHNEIERNFILNMKQMNMGNHGNE